MNFQGGLGSGLENGWDVKVTLRSGVGATLKGKLEQTPATEGKKEIE